MSDAVYQRKPALPRRIRQLNFIFLYDQYDNCPCLPAFIILNYSLLQVHTVGSRPTIERLSFINHTECACINRLEPIHSTSVSPISTVPPVVVTAPVCTCPSLFQRVIDNDNRCFCDCSSSDTQCDQFKRGLEHFSMENRR